MMTKKMLMVLVGSLIVSLSAKVSASDRDDDISRIQNATRVFQEIMSLFWAVLGTQTLATLIACIWSVHGADWMALFVWGYALAWFLVNDRVKLGTHRVFDPQGVGLMAHCWEKQNLRSQAN